MITNDVSTCPKCGGDLKYYDRVTRIVRTKGRKTWKIPMRRLQCTRCGSVHRELPELIFPYKQYEAEVIIGVLEGFITCETIGFEDYPCEMTMVRWQAQDWTTEVVLTTPMNEQEFPQGSVPVAVAARVYGKDASWVRAGIISGWLPIGKATRSGKLVTAIEEMDSRYGRINFYISPKRLYEETGFLWKGERQ